MIKQLFIASALATSLIACNNATSNANTEIADTNKVTSDNTLGNPLDASMQGNPTDQNVSTTPVNQENKSGNVALNPEHGQPGHRCDIAVGAPLNSAPAANAPAVEVKSAPQTQATQPVQVQAPTPQMPAQKTEAGFSGKPNPAHGQPGHRCDLEVGAILP